MIIDKIYSELESQNFSFKIVSIKHISELKNEIETLFKTNVFSDYFYEEYFSNFFNFPDNLPKPASLIIVALPEPQYTLHFNLGGELFDLLIPPTYLKWNQIRKKVGNQINSIISPFGYKVTRARIPEKLLVVQSGLGRYGRNNISYIGGMGSFHRPIALYSDLPCEQDNWVKPLMAKECEKCNACINNCPTGAITKDRFLIYHERCLTYHNEKPSKIPFPSWIKPSAHNCVVGCMKCQNICPMNIKYKDWVEKGPVFDQDETNILLKENESEKLPGKLLLKLKEYDMVEYLNVMPRNLRTLMDQYKK